MNTDGREVPQGGQGGVETDTAADDLFKPEGEAVFNGPAGVEPTDPATPEHLLARQARAELEAQYAEAETERGSSPRVAAEARTGSTGGQSAWDKIKRTVGGFFGGNRES